MNRFCKNCGSQIYESKTYCADCGAKWIDNRITMRNVASDFSDMYLGWDNKFLITFSDLFARPETVINGYINGHRGKYIEAVRYILLAVFLAGVYILVLKNVEFDMMSIANPEMYRSLGYSEEMIAQATRMNEKWMGVVLDYQGIIILSSIPIYAVIARITFWKESRFYNFTEHIVFFLYVFGQASMISSLISLVLLGINQDFFMYWLYSFIPLQILYTAYCYMKCFKLSIQQIFLKTLLFIVVLLGIYIAVIIVGVIIGVLLKIAGII